MPVDPTDLLLLPPKTALRDFFIGAHCGGLGLQYAILDLVCDVVFFLRDLADLTDFARLRLLTPGKAKLFVIAARLMAPLGPCEYTSIRRSSLFLRERGFTI